jgi:hypothetical protein
MYIIPMGDYYAQLIRETDLKLNDRAFINSLYDQWNLPHPSKYNFEWKMDSLDLGLLDKKTGVYFRINEGPV